jgi:hypothetical protein
MHGIWSFLQVESNRTVLTWIGGGVVVVASGIWTVWKFKRSSPAPKSTPDPTVTATDGSFAAGRDLNISGKIDTRGGTKR